MMKNIESFEVILYLLPLPEPVGAAASGVMREFEMVMVRIRDTDGNEGCGYTALMVNQGAAVSKIIENVCAEIVKSEDPRNIEWIWSKIWKTHHYGDCWADTTRLSGLTLEILISTFPSINC